MATKARKDDLQAEVFERQARICKAFANSTRLRMLDLLGKRDCCATELQQELRISKANLSQHIAVLKGAGIVDARRAGKAVYFSLTMPEVKSACHLILPLPASLPISCRTSRRSAFAKIGEPLKPSTRTHVFESLLLQIWFKAERNPIYG